MTSGKKGSTDYFHISQELCSQSYHLFDPPKPVNERMDIYGPENLHLQQRYTEQSLSKFTVEQVYHLYDCEDYLRKNLSALDPEGCSLHDILERILFSAPQKKDFTTSFWNLVLKNCHLVARRIHVEIQLPVLNDEFMCFGEIKELSVRSKYVDKKCLLTGFLSTIFIPMKDITLILKGVGFRATLVGKNPTGNVLLSFDMQIDIKFRDLKLASCTLCFPELAFSFSPDGISVCLLFHKLISNMYHQSRGARELWRIAASRIDHVIVTPRLSFHRLVGVMGQWIHYANAYENILLLIGYSTSRTWKKSISKMSLNKLILSSVSRHWKLISDIEKKLPVEGIYHWQGE